MNLGKVIKHIRQKKNLKQGEFAEMCGITQAYLSQIESNLKEPNISTLKTIATQLHIPLPILFFLSLDDDDIQPEKKEAYRLLGPSIKSLINEFFTNETD